MNSKIAHILAIAGLLSASIAHAQYREDHPEFGIGSLYVDANGLSWLLVEPTKGWDFVEIQDQFGAEGAFPGFRHATPAEFFSLLSEFNISNDPNTSDLDQLYSAIDMLDIFGATLFQENGSPDGIIYSVSAVLGGYLNDGTIGEVYYSLETIFSNTGLISSGGWNPQTVEDYQPAHFLVLNTETATFDGLIDEILAALDAGTISGTGKGASASNRVSALLNMIYTAGDLIEQGYLEEGCQQLADVLAKCDGQNNPPDFISGPDTAYIAFLVLELMDLNGCRVVN